MTKTSQEIRPLFDLLQNQISVWSSSIDFVAKKSYVSISEKLGKEYVTSTCNRK